MRQLMLLTVLILALVCHSSLIAEKHALVIGIHYDHLGDAAIPECEKDAKAIAALLETKFNFLPQNIILLTNKNATRSGILEKLQLLQQKAKKDDSILIYYSGHGQTLPDDNGDEKKKNAEDTQDETLCPYDQKNIRDDELGVIFDKIASKGANVFIMFDSCYSGTATKDVSLSNKKCYSKPKVFRPKSSKSTLTDTRNVVPVRRANNNTPRPTSGQSQIYETNQSTAGIVIFFSASADCEVSWTLEGKGNSAFTYHFLHQIDNMTSDTNRDGKITFNESYQYIKQQVSQEPLPIPQNPTVEADEKILQNLTVYPNFFGKLSSTDEPPNTNAQPAPDLKLKMYDLLEKLIIRQCEVPAAEDWKIKADLIPTSKTIPLGEYIQVEVTPNHDGYLLVLNITEKGSATLLFPNMEAKNHKVVAHQKVFIPPEDAEWSIQAQPPAGKEWIVAYLFEKDPLAGVDLIDTFEEEFMANSNVEVVNSHRLQQENVEKLIKYLTSPPQKTQKQEEVITGWTSASIEFETKP